MAKTSPTVVPPRVLLRRAGVAGLVAAGLVLVLRLVAWRLSGSLAVLADSLDPALNLAAAATTLVGVLGARRPADERHPFGHRALEYVTVGVQGALALAGVGVVVLAAGYQLRAGQPMVATPLALGLFLLSLVTNAALAHYQSAVARRCGSPAMAAAGQHARIDVWVGVGVLANLLLTGWLRIVWLDILVSVVVVQQVGRHALHLLRNAALGLLDTAGAASTDVCRSTLAGLVGSEIIGYHDVRCRDAGGYHFIDFHLQFADGTSLERAHALAEEAEAAVQRAIGRCDATAHLETAAQVRADRDHEPPATGPEQRGRRRAALVSLVTGTLLMLIKMGAALLTGSAALLSDALESIVNVLGAGFALYSVGLSRSGSDDAHPYGHEKIEYLAAGFEGSLIGLAGLLIMVAAARRLMSGAQIENLDSGLVLCLVATVVNGLLGAYLVKTGKRLGSLTLVADGHHVLTDVWTSSGVLVALLIVLFTGWQTADPLIAILVAVGILFTASQLLNKALHGVMDSVDEPTRARAEAVLDASVGQRGIIGWHGLRVREVGERRFVEAHAQFAEGTGLAEAHSVSEWLEGALCEALAPADAILHAEPADERLDPDRV